MVTVVTNEEHVTSVRRQVVALVQDMLCDHLCFLEGARLLASLQHEAAVEADDPDFTVFVGIASETDNLPIGRLRIHWSAEALARHQPEIDAVTKWAKSHGVEA